MNTNIDSHKLIAAVYKRPALYDKSHKMHYCHNKFKQRLWKETCAEIYPNWELIPLHKRMEYGRAVQKRWKNLRTCFTREVALQQKEVQDMKEGREVKPRKIYEYYNIMRFMLTDDQKAKLQVVQIQNDTNTCNGNVDDDPLENVKAEFEQQITYEKDPNSYDYDDDDDDDDDDNIMVIEPEERYAPEVSNETNEERQVNDYSKDDDDDDKHFLMSLLRTFRQFDDKQKFEAKIEILKTLKTIQFPDD